MATSFNFEAISTYIANSTAYVANTAQAVTHQAFDVARGKVISELSGTALSFLRLSDTSKNLARSILNQQETKNLLTSVADTQNVNTLLDVAVNYQNASSKEQGATLKVLLQHGLQTIRNPAVSQAMLNMLTPSITGAALSLPELRLTPETQKLASHILTQPQTKALLSKVVSSQNMSYVLSAAVDYQTARPEQKNAALKGLINQGVTAMRDPSVSQAMLNMLTPSITDAALSSPMLGLPAATQKLASNILSQPQTRELLGHVVSSPHMSNTISLL